MAPNPEFIILPVAFTGIQASVGRNGCISNKIIPTSVSSISDINLRLIYKIQPTFPVYAPELNKCQETLYFIRIFVFFRLYRYHSSCKSSRLYYICARFHVPSKQFYIHSHNCFILKKWFKLQVKTFSGRYLNYKVLFQTKVILLFFQLLLF